MEKVEKLNNQWHEIKREPLADALEKDNNCVSVIVAEVPFIYSDYTISQFAPGIKVTGINHKGTEYTGYLILMNSNWNIPIDTWIEADAVDIVYLEDLKGVIIIRAAIRY